MKKVKYFCEYKNVINKFEYWTMLQHASLNKAIEFEEIWIKEITSTNVDSYLMDERGRIRYYTKHYAFNKDKWWYKFDPKSNPIFADTFWGLSK